MADSASPMTGRASSAGRGLDWERSLRLEIMERVTKLWLLQRFAMAGAVVIAVCLHLLRNIETLAPVEWWSPLILLMVCGIPAAVGMSELITRLSTYVAIENDSLSEEESRWSEQFSVQTRNEVYAFLFLWTFAIIASIWIGLHGL